MEWRAILPRERIQAESAASDCKIGITYMQHKELLLCQYQGPAR